MDFNVPRQWLFIGFPPTLQELPASLQARENCHSKQKNGRWRGGERHNNKIKTKRNSGSKKTFLNNKTTRESISE